PDRRRLSDLGRHGWCPGCSRVAYADLVENTAPVIFELGLVLLLAALAGWMARRAGLPAVVGYLVVGLAVSPFTPGYVADRHQLAVLADLGVVLLLFEVGIEIDPLRLRRERGKIGRASCRERVGRSGVAGR